MRHYYNEIDPYAAQWLCNLIVAGHLPAGDVDMRSIVDVQPQDLIGYTSCHFFAGIGGWAYAARLAGWPDDRPIWTGSPPCQPFSVAGKGGAHDDERHLWPHLFRLIRARRPARFVGEQVAAAVGRDWLDGVLTDMEGIAYAGRAVVVPACAVNAPHRRDRLWVAFRDRMLGDGDHARLEGHVGYGAEGAGRPIPHGPVAEAGGSSCGAVSELADAGDDGCTQGLAGSAPTRHRGVAGAARCAGGGSAVGHTDDDAAGRDAGSVSEAEGGIERCMRSEPHGSADAGRGHGTPWDDAGWILGHDGKARRVKPGVRLLAHGVSGRVGKLRAYGNAIVPAQAAIVIRALMDTENTP